MPGRGEGHSTGKSPFNLGKGATSSCPGPTLCEIIVLLFQGEKQELSTLEGEL